MTPCIASDVGEQNVIFGVFGDVRGVAFSLSIACLAQHITQNELLGRERTLTRGTVTEP